MCLIAFAWQAHPRHALVIAANRDEFHQRPTEAAHWWETPYGLFAGRDIQAGGAWCGIDVQGRFAAVTNVREPAAGGDLKSRGWLVRDYFDQSGGARDWAERVAADGAAFGPFNLLIGDRDSLWFMSNRGHVRQRQLTPGVYAISNGHWGDHWPKTDLAQSRLNDQLAGDDLNTESAFDLLADTDPAPSVDLPDTGIGRARERFLSSVFIKSPQYGTRASTVITRDHDGLVNFHERGFAADASIVHCVHDTWRIAPEPSA